MLRLSTLGLFVFLLPLATAAAFEQHLQEDHLHAALESAAQLVLRQHGGSYGTAGRSLLATDQVTTDANNFLDALRNYFKWSESQHKAYKKSALGDMKSCVRAVNANPANNKNIENLSSCNAAKIIASNKCPAKCKSALKALPKSCLTAFAKAPSPLGCGMRGQAKVCKVPHNAKGASRC